MNSNRSSNRSSNKLQLKNNYRMYEGGDEKEKSVSIASRASKRSSTNKKSQPKKPNANLSSKNLLSKNFEND